MIIMPGMGISSLPKLDAKFLSCTSLHFHEVEVFINVSAERAAVNFRAVRLPQFFAIKHSCVRIQEITGGHNFWILSATFAGD